MNHIQYLSIINHKLKKPKDLVIKLQEILEKFGTVTVRKCDEHQVSFIVNFDKRLYAEKSGPKTDYIKSIIRKPFVISLCIHGFLSFEVETDEKFLQEYFQTTLGHIESQIKENVKLRQKNQILKKKDCENATQYAEVVTCNRTKRETTKQLFAAQSKRLTKQLDNLKMILEARVRVILGGLDKCTDTCNTLRSTEKEVHAFAYKSIFTDFHCDVTDSTDNEIEVHAMKLYKICEVKRKCIEELLCDHIVGTS